MASPGTNPVMSFVGGLALGIPVAAVGLVRMGQDVAEDLRVRTGGVVVRAELEESRRVARGRTTSEWTARVRYVYEVHGERIEGDVISDPPPGRFTSEEAATAFLAPYAEGSAVTVFYDPEDPHHAMLTHRPSTGGGWWVLMGLALIAVGVGHWVIAP